MCVCVSRVLLLRHRGIMLEWEKYIMYIMQMWHRGIFSHCMRGACFSLVNDLTRGDRYIVLFQYLLFLFQWCITIGGWNNYHLTKRLTVAHNYAFRVISVSFVYVVQYWKLYSQFLTEDKGKHKRSIDMPMLWFWLSSVANYKVIITCVEATEAKC